MYLNVCYFLDNKANTKIDLNYNISNSNSNASTKSLKRQTIIFLDNIQSNNNATNSDQTLNVNLNLKEQQTRIPTVNILLNTYSRTRLVHEPISIDTNENNLTTYTQPQISTTTLPDSNPNISTINIRDTHTEDISEVNSKSLCTTSILSITTLLSSKN